MSAFGDVVRNLAWLDDHEALAGVAEVIRERRRQIEQLGHTAEHDDEHTRGQLLQFARARIAQAAREVHGGTGGYPEQEEALRQAGALYAAEIDRLNRMLGGFGGTT